jgi:hypothetical protein
MEGAEGGKWRRRGRRRRRSSSRKKSRSVEGETKGVKGRNRKTEDQLKEGREPLGPWSRHPHKNKWEGRKSRLNAFRGGLVRSKGFPSNFGEEGVPMVGRYLIPIILIEPHPP